MLKHLHYTKEVNIKLVDEMVGHLSYTLPTWTFLQMMCTIAKLQKCVQELEAQQGQLQGQKRHGLLQVSLTLLTSVLVAPQIHLVSLYCLSASTAPVLSASPMISNLGSLGSIDLHRFTLLMTEAATMMIQLPGVEVNARLSNSTVSAQLCQWVRGHNTCPNSVGEMHLS